MPSSPLRQAARPANSVISTRSQRILEIPHAQSRKQRRPARRGAQNPRAYRRGRRCWNRRHCNQRLQNFRDAVATLGGIPAVKQASDGIRRGRRWSLGEGSRTSLICSRPSVGHFGRSATSGSSMSSMPTCSLSRDLSQMAVQLLPIRTIRRSR
jgi:hypothetical protein